MKSHLTRTQYSLSRYPACLFSLVPMDGPRITPDQLRGRTASRLHGYLSVGDASSGILLLWSSRTSIVLEIHTFRRYSECRKHPLPMAYLVCYIEYVGYPHKSIVQLLYRTNSRTRATVKVTRPATSRSCKVYYTAHAQRHLYVITALDANFIHYVINTSGLKTPIFLSSSCD